MITIRVLVVIGVIFNIISILIHHAYCREAVVLIDNPAKG